VAEVSKLSEIKLLYPNMARDFACGIVGIQILEPWIQIFPKAKVGKPGRSRENGTFVNQQANKKLNPVHSNSY
jgi:hypothetical protein